MYSRYPSYEPSEHSGQQSAHSRFMREPPRRMPETPPEPPPEAPSEPKAKRGAIGSAFKGLGGLLNNLKIDWDAGDILLILIILLLSVESDDTELLIILGLVLFMGL